jgi:hypothetical protein
MKAELDTLKLWLEIAAFGFAAVFILTKLIGGQFNAGAEMSVETIREHIPGNKAEDFVAIVIKLKRSDIGRIEVHDILIEATDLVDGSKIKVPRQERLVTERKPEKDQNGRFQATENLSNKGVFLPPGDATQFAYLLRVKRTAPVLVDVTILASRSGPWIGQPQWRGSAVSLPKENSNN